MKKKIVVGLIAIALLAIGGYFAGQSIFKAKPASAENQLKSFLAANPTSDSVKEAYQFAVQNPDGIMDHVPCHCGCESDGEHVSNRNCFIDSEENGQIAFDKMGLNCGTCVGTAKLTKDMQQQGKSLSEIVDQVNQKFKGDNDE